MYSIYLGTGSLKSINTRGIYRFVQIRIRRVLHVGDFALIGPETDLYGSSDAFPGQKTDFSPISNS